MSDAKQRRRRVSRSTAPGNITCPACGGPLKAEAKWCPNCNFTGGDTMAMFPEEPPPLPPILDAVGLLEAGDLPKIEAARGNLRRRFPQFEWKICIVSLPPQTSLPVFGFWLLNACPLHGGETSEQRAWTVLLLIDSGTGRASVAAGYGAEPFLSDDEWKAILGSMTEPWSRGNPAKAIIGFFKNSRSSLDAAWKRYGARR